MSVRDRARLRDRVRAGRPRRPRDRRRAGDRDPRVRERRHRRAPARPRRRRRPRAGLGAPGPRRLPRDDPLDGARGSSRETGVDPADVVGVGIDFTACTMLPTTADGTPLCRAARSSGASRTPGSSSGSTTPPSPRRTGSTRRPRRAASRGCRATAAGSRRSGSTRRASRSSTRRPHIYARRRPADRGGRLGRLAADRASRRATRAPPATRRSGRSRTGSRTPSYFGALDPRLRARSSTTRCRATSRPIGERAGELSRRGRGVDRACGRGPPVAIANVDAHVSVPAVGVIEPGTMVAVMGTSTCHMVLGSRLVAGRGDVRRRRGRDHPRLLRLRGGPVGRRRHLRLVHEAGRPARGPRGRPGATASTSTACSSATPRALRPGEIRAPRARLVERQSLDPRRRRAERPARRGDAGDAAGRHLPGAARVDRLRDAGDHRVARGGRRRASSASSPAAACRNGTSC